MGKKYILHILGVLVCCQVVLADLDRRCSVALVGEISPALSLVHSQSLPRDLILTAGLEGCQAWLAQHVVTWASGGVEDPLVMPGATSESMPAGRRMPGSDKSSRSDDVVELPPPPSGSTLTLSGLLTLGALHFARSARNGQLAAFFRVGHVPDWYHTDAIQVGHSVPFDLRAGLELTRSSSRAILETGRPRFVSAHYGTDSFVRSEPQPSCAGSPRSPPRTPAGSSSPLQGSVYVLVFS